MIKFLCIFMAMQLKHDQADAKEGRLRTGDQTNDCTLENPVWVRQGYQEKFTTTCSSSVLTSPFI